ncbi:MAG: bifunctional adenosylcobinamide kinase/adenosylcobinamide-phosphate guanylyltransferase [Polyangiaceae bacterium]|jgi:adenosylcobinamide kinase/adenosylcobinamide-phosphate guanylyltransferase
MMALVLGGVRSGKSRFAQRVALELSNAPVYLATSRAWDEDHAARIARHRSDRGPEWMTIEEERSIARPELAGRVVVVDCVTLWLTNLFADSSWRPSVAWDLARMELERLMLVDATWILVSNELGSGPHASTHEGRAFVDTHGFLNQAIAAQAVAVTWMVAGIAVAIKGETLPGALRTATP